MNSLIVSFCVALGVTAISGAFVIPALRKLKAGQNIREEGPKWHAPKQGTPTMGGVMFILGISIAVPFAGFEAMLEGDFRMLFVPAFALVFGIIGFIDDYFKVKRKRNLGLSSLQKLLLQLSAAGAFMAMLRYFGYITSNVYIPFADVSVPMSWLMYLFISLVYIAGFVNAVNLTDGVDGLACGVTFPIAVFFLVISVQWAGPEAMRDLIGVKEIIAPPGALFAAALAGGLIGFLIFNFHPAKVFMGDTGSLYLGGGLCGLAFISDAPLLLIPVGAVYLVEMFSVIIQVLYFKFSGGKRVFKMTPIHHHFEMSGWSEKKLFCVFFAVTAVLCAVTWFFVNTRYQI